jgi:hypothetical protein
MNIQNFYKFLSISKTTTIFVNFGSGTYRSQQGGGGVILGASGQVAVCQGEMAVGDAGERHIQLELLYTYLIKLYT